MYLFAHHTLGHTVSMNIPGFILIGLVVAVAAYAISRGGK
jgi:hypothetical protein